MSPGASRPLRPAVAVGAGVFLAILAFPASLLGLVRLAASPVPESLSLGVIVVSAVWAWAVMSMPADGPGAPSRNDRAIAFGVLVLVAVVAWLWPADELTDLGRWRPGLFLLAPFACALALVALGRDGLRRLAGPVALLVIAWPPLAALLAAPLVPPPPEDVEPLKVCVWVPIDAASGLLLFPGGAFQARYVPLSSLEVDPEKEWL